MSRLRQLLVLLQMNLSGIPSRWGSSVVTVVGVTCVVGVLVAMLSMGNGVRQSSNQYARADRAEVLSQGSYGPVGSTIDPSAARTIEDLPGIRKDALGKPLATAETLVIAEARKKTDNTRVTFPMFGIDSQFNEVFPELHLVDGRMFRPAVDEIIVSQSRREQFKGLELGDRVHLHGVDWTVVGHFTSSGPTEESFIGDAQTVMSAYQHNSVQVVSVVLDSPASFNTLSAALKANPTFNVTLNHEADMAAQMSRGITGILDFISYFVGAVMAVGATLGAINVMYTVVDSRRRDIATLRAIGFRSGPIVLSVIAESMALALPGALLGVLLAWLFFNASAVSPLGISIHMAVTLQLAELGIGWAIVMGLIGGALPAVRAARVSVAAALRTN